jgi:hypothetical protein
MQRTKEKPQAGDKSFLHQLRQRTADLNPGGRDLLPPSHLCQTKHEQIAREIGSLSLADKITAEN